MDESRLAEYLSPNTNRYKHIIGVVQQMQALIPQLPSIPKEWEVPLIHACFLHDIGYSQRLKDTNYHPYDGAVFAQAHGYPKSVVNAVLFHSCAYETVKKTRLDLIEKYQQAYNLLEEKDHLFIDLVTYCDLHTAPTGVKVDLQTRIQDVVNRYGEEHEVSQLMLANEPQYKQVIERINKRKAQP